MTRPVDQAMDLERPEKKTVRLLWLETIQEYRDAFPGDDVPLYLTLSGAHGHDIQLLISHGIIRKTETGAIDPSDAGVAVAIESSSTAVLELQRRLPGLQILEQSFDSLIRSGRLTVFPQGEHIRLCQARVVNLDLNQSVQFANIDGELTFPPLQWVRKLCILHADRRLEWCLLLTLHGEAVWDSNETRAVAEYLAENFARENSFADAALVVLGDNLFARVSDGTIPAATTLSHLEQQLLLMAYVPKQIAQIAHQYGWRTETKRNLRYGGVSGRAPIVTWVIRFHWDDRLSRQPNAIYLDSLKLIFSGVGHIAEDGSFS